MPVLSVLSGRNTQTINYKNHAPFSANNDLPIANFGNDLVRDYLSHAGLTRGTPILKPNMMGNTAF